MNCWRRVAAVSVVLWAAVSYGAPAHAEGETVRVRLFADTDDDDSDGARDREGSPETAADVRWIDAAPGRTLLFRSVSGPSVRVIAGPRTYTDEKVQTAVAVARLGLQGLEPGRAVLDVGSHRIAASVCEFLASDIDGKRVDLARSHASLSRTLPPKLAKQADGSRDNDALSWIAVCPPGAVPRGVQIESTSPQGELLDAIDFARLAPAPCPKGVGADLECGRTAPIRATADIVDRAHPASAAESLRAEVGGRIVLEVDGAKASSIRVGGPRDTQLGPLGRYRARIRIHVMRMAPGGAVGVGGTDAGAFGVARDEIRTASALWGQCGIVFDEEPSAQVRIVDPPPPFLLAVGCDLGLPASGGAVSVRVDGRAVEVATRPGETPVEVAGRLVEAARLAGVHATLSPNPRISQGALRSVDVLFRRADGRLASVETEPGGPSTDATLSACIGKVDFADGLTHFGDLDASSGTLEERTLLKAVQDADPATIDVVIVPAFSRSGRIGESFIDADGSSVRNVVIVDRAGIRAGARSFALAHELGHILLDMPGHPDDYGVDRPWALMDADAADPSIFGPRRLPVADCERALRQSGPSAPIPLLAPWPLVRPSSEITGPRSP